VLCKRRSRRSYNRDFAKGEGSNKSGHARGLLISQPRTHGMCSRNEEAAETAVNDSLAQSTFCRGKPAKSVNSKSTMMLGCSLLHVDPR